MKKVLSIILLAAMVMTLLVACKDDGEHTHTYSDAWSKDENNHWHAASCEHTDEKKDVAAHEDADGNFFCDVCEYPIDHTHTYEDTWTQTDKTHYYKSTCGHDVKKAEALHTDTDNNSVCDVCEYDYDHTHTYASAWSYDADNHWHAVSCGHDVDAADKASHADTDNNGICDVCEYDYDHDHTYSAEWSSDANNHFHAASCGHDVPAKDTAPHVDTDKNGICDECNYVVCAHTYADAWSSDADNHWKEVTCGCSVSAGSFGAHVDNNSDKTCDTCGYIAQHFHTFDSSAWVTDATGHWYASTCGHDVKDAYADHTDTDTNGKCDICSYVIFNIYTITTDKADYVTVEGLTSAKEGTDVTLTITVPDNAELVSVTGAEYVSGPEAGRNAYVYTYKIAAISANTTVEIVTNKLIASEEIVLGDDALTVDPDNSFFWIDTITFNAPSAGKYIIYSSDETVQFGPEDDSLSPQRTYVFTVETAGEVSVYVEKFVFSSDDAPEDGTYEYDYEIHKIDDEITLKAASGSGYVMPNNVNINVSYTVAETGLYQIKSNTKQLRWNDEILTVYTFKANAGDTITFTLLNENFAQPTFDFDWEIELVPSATITDGENEISVPFEGHIEVSYTAAIRGTYNISFSGNNEYSMIYFWSDTYNRLLEDGNSYLFEDVEAGQTVSFFIFARDYEYTLTEDVADILTVTNMGNKATLTEDGYNSAASAEGMHNYINVSTEGDYQIIVPEGVSVSFDGGETWLTGGDNTLFVREDTILNYIVKTEDGSDSAVIGINLISYEFELVVGENTVTMLPDKEYTVYLTGFGNIAYYKDFILNWTNEDVTVTYSGINVASGETVSQYSTYYSLTIVYNGEAKAEISFTLEDPVGAPVPPAAEDIIPLLVGKYSHTQYGSVNFTLTFTPSFDGAYAGTMVMSAEEFSYDIWDYVTVTTNYTYEYVDGDGVVIKDENGEQQVIFLGVNDSGELTYQSSEYTNVTVLVPENGGSDDEDPSEGGSEEPSEGNTEKPSEGGSDAPTESGSINVTTTDTYCYIDEYTFVAPYSGEYKFTVPAGLGFYSKSASDKWADAEVDFQLNPEGGSFNVTLDEGENYVFYVGAMSKKDWTVTYTVKVSESTGGGEGGDEGGTVNPTDIYGTYNGSGYNPITLVLNETTMTFTQGENTVTFNYTIADGVVTIYQADGTTPWNSMFYALELTDGVPTYATYNGNSYELTKIG